MSTPADPYWPQVGSVWHHWSDLLVATQLAAARAGFTNVGRAWDSRLPNKLPMKSSPTSPWTVTEIQSAQLESSRHPEHATGPGLSESLKEPPAGPLSLGPGDDILGFRALHTLEGLLKADSRRKGCFLMSALEPTSNIRDFTCILGASLCHFLVRLKECDDSEEVERRWRCTEVRHAHTCVSEAAPPQPALLERLDFFPLPLPKRLPPPVKTLSLSASTKSRSSKSASSSTAKFPIPKDLTELAHAVKKLRKVVLEEVKELERQKEDLEMMMDEKEVEKAATALTAASASFKSTSYAHLEALTSALQERVEARDLKQWKEKQLESRMQELLDDLL
ncbi:hypothetical protein JCM8097_000449 [Rhodosporidiobolus ruineniae]